MNTDFSLIAGLIAKVFVVFGLVLYGVFAVVMVRQEQLMAHVVEESFQPVLRTLVLIHLLASLGIIFLAIVLL